MKWIRNLLILVALPVMAETHFSLDHATVGIHVVRRDTGEVLLSQNKELSLVPASCLKLVTTAAALEILGPESRFTTMLEYDGTIEDGTLLGNLYIHGGGDPCLGSDRVKGSLSWEQQLAAWADAVAKLGIVKVTGQVIPDTSCWESACAAPSWTWEDVGNYYGAGASALSFHDNLYTVSFKPGAALGAETTLLETDPPIQTVLRLHNEVKSGPVGSGDQASIYGGEFSTEQFIRGAIPMGVERFSIKGAIPNPPALCAALLTQELRKIGIEVIGKKENQSQKRTSFHTTMSPTLQDIVYWINQKSINLYSEHLLKKIGEKHYGEGSTEAGLKALSTFWKAKGLSLQGTHFADGSGLSRKNAITPKQLVEMALKMQSSDYFPILIESLPTYHDTIRAKSGFQSGIRGFVGFTDKIAFTILVNHGLDVEARKEMIERFFLHIKELDQSL